MPVDAETMPVDAEAMTVDVEAMPIDVEAMPVDVEAMPVDAEAMPVDVEAMPVDAGVETTAIETQVKPKAVKNYHETNRTVSLLRRQAKLTQSRHLTAKYLLMT